MMPCCSCEERGTQCLWFSLHQFPCFPIPGLFFFWRVVCVSVLRNDFASGAPCPREEVGRLLTTSSKRLEEEHPGDTAVAAQGFASAVFGLVASLAFVVTLWISVVTLSSVHL